MDNFRNVIIQDVFVQQSSDGGRVSLRSPLDSSALCYSLLSFVSLLQKQRQEPAHIQN